MGKALQRCLEEDVFEFLGQDIDILAQRFLGQGFLGQGFWCRGRGILGLLSRSDWGKYVFGLWVLVQGLLGLGVLVQGFLRAGIPKGRVLVNYTVPSI